MINNAHEFFNYMRNGDVVVFTFGTLLMQIIGKCFVPITNIDSGIVKCVAQITGTPFLHVGISVVKFAGLVSGRRNTRKSENFIRRIESGEVADFGKNYSSHAKSQTGN